MASPPSQFVQTIVPTQLRITVKSLTLIPDSLAKCQTPLTHPKG